DGVGFEPTRPLRACRFSRPEPSTTRPPILGASPTRRRRTVIAPPEPLKPGSLYPILSRLCHYSAHLGSRRKARVGPKVMGLRRTGPPYNKEYAGRAGLHYGHLGAIARAVRARACDRRGNAAGDDARHRRVDR